MPDFHFPVQFDDVLRATRHFMHPEVLAQYSVDPSRVAISGDSAGGNLAAAVCQEVTAFFLFMEIMCVCPSVINGAVVLASTQLNCDLSGRAVSQGRRAAGY